MGGGELLENLQDDLSQDEDQNEPSNFQAWLVIVLLLVLIIAQKRALRKSRCLLTFHNLSHHTKSFSGTSEVPTTPKVGVEKGAPSGK